MNRFKAFVFACLLALGCGAAEDGYDAEDQGDVYEDTDIGILEQALSFSDSYGLQSGSGAGQSFRCVTGQSSDCMVPRFKKVQIGLNTDGVPLNADRVLFSTAVDNAITLGNTHASGFSYNRENGTGCDPDEVCITIHAQSASAPTGGFTSDDIRRYVSLQFTGGVDLGAVRTFKGIAVHVNWTALKTYRGDSTCTNTSGDVCFNGMGHVVKWGAAAATGAGTTTNSSVTGKGNDRDVDGNTGSLMAAVDICRAAQYNASNPSSFTTFADTCGF